MRRKPMRYHCHLSALASLPLAFVILLGSPAIGQAGKTGVVTVTNFSQSAAPAAAGQEAYFTVTLTNTDTSATLLGGLTIGFLNSGGSYLTPDTENYDNNVNGLVSMPASSSYTMAPGGSQPYFFGVTSSPSTPAASYSAYVEINDGAGSGSILASKDFSVVVSSAAPEPQPTTAFLIGFMGLGLLIIARSRQTWSETTLKRASPTA
jgi:hypothetical protein